MNESIPAGASIFAVRTGSSSSPALNGDILMDHHQETWRFIRVVESARVSDCRVTARHAVSGKVVTVAPQVFNLRIVWEQP